MSSVTSVLGDELKALMATPAALVERLAQHDALLRFDDFGYEDAWRLGTRIREIAVRESLPIAIGITLGQQRVFHAALAGSSANNDLWAARKTAIVTLFGQSSFSVGAENLRTGSTIFDRLSPSDYADHGGAVPIMTRGGSLLGVVVVSGLPQAHDHAVAVTALAELCGVPTERL